MKHLTRRKYTTATVSCAAVAVFVLLLSPGIGVRPPYPLEAWRLLLTGQQESVAFSIAFDLRMPQACLAILAGGTLALCGAVFQVLFRNPLATPYTLGVAGGASLGAMIAIVAGWTGLIAGIATKSISAFCGSLLILLVLVLLSRTSRKISGNALLLAGVTLGFFCSALIMFVMSIANPLDTYQVVHWMMGSLQVVSYHEVVMLLPILLPMWILLILQSRALNQFEYGIEISESRGVNTTALQLICLLSASVAIAAVVSICGPIGFVGVIIPHAVRMVFGGDNRLVLPASCLLGGAFLVVCLWLTSMLPAGIDYLFHTKTDGVVLPIGVITALIGAPLFVWILYTRGRLKE